MNIATMRSVLVPGTIKHSKEKGERPEACEIRLLLVYQNYCLHVCFDRKLILMRVKQEYDCSYKQVKPPSTRNSLPVVKLDASLAKYIIAPAISSGIAKRPNGVALIQKLRISSGTT